MNFLTKVLHSVWCNLKIRQAKMLIAGIVLMLLSCRKETDKMIDPEPNDTLKSQRTGLVLTSREQYENIRLIEEPLVNARTNDKSVLPESYLLANLLPVGDQKNMESCVGWATAYAARTMLLNHDKRPMYTDPAGNLLGEFVFSPEFVWTSINGGINKGVQMFQAFDLIQHTGVAKWKDFPTKYQPSPGPGNAQKQLAANFKIKNWGRIAINQLTFQKFLFFDNPIIVALKLDDNFLNPTEILPDGSVRWSKYGSEKGAHAAVIVGYSKERNAFLIQNSWGKNWGEKLKGAEANGKLSGFLWIDYELLTKAVFEAYVMVSNDSGLEKPVVQTHYPLEVSDKEVPLTGTIDNFQDAPVSEYGFLISSDSSDLIIGTKAEIITDKTILQPPYSFSKTYNPKGPGRKFFRAFARSYTEVYYGKILDFIVPEEIVDAGNIGGDILVSTEYDNVYTETKGYEHFNNIRKFVFNITFREIHKKYKYRALYLLTADGNYFTVSHISDGPAQEAIAYLDLTDSSWILSLPTGQYTQGSELPRIPLYNLTDLDNFGEESTRVKYLYTDQVDRFRIVMSDTPDFKGKVIKSEINIFPKVLNSDGFKPSKTAPSPILVSF